MVGMIGLNSTGLPALPNRFAPVNSLALQQQFANGGFMPAYAAPVDLPPNQTPSAAQALAEAGGGRQGFGVTPNSATPPVQPSVGAASPAGAGAPGAPPTWPDLMQFLTQAQAGIRGDAANIGQALSNGVYGVGQAVAQPFLQALSLFGGGAAPAAPTSAQGRFSTLLPPPPASTPGQGVLQ